MTAAGVSERERERFLAIESCLLCVGGDAGGMIFDTLLINPKRNKANHRNMIIKA